MNTATIIKSLNNKLKCKVSVKYSSLYVDGVIAIKLDRSTLVTMLSRLNANADKLVACPGCGNACSVLLDCGPSFRSRCDCGIEGTMAAIPVDTNINWKKRVSGGYTISLSKFGDRLNTELYRGKDSIRRYSGCEIELATKQAMELSATS